MNWLPPLDLLLNGGASRLGYCTFAIRRGLEPLFALRQRAVMTFSLTDQIYCASPEGFEPPTSTFVALRSNPAELWRHLCAVDHLCTPVNPIVWLTTILLLPLGSNQTSSPVALTDDEFPFCADARKPGCTQEPTFPAYLSRPSTPRLPMYCCDLPSRCGVPENRTRQLLWRADLQSALVPRPHAVWGKSPGARGNLPSPRTCRVLLASRLPLLCSPQGPQPLRLHAGTCLPARLSSPYPARLPMFLQVGVIDGARTRDIRLHKPALYQLSYDHRRNDRIRTCVNLLPKQAGNHYPTFR